MSKRLFLPSAMTPEQEKWLTRITDQLAQHVPFKNEEVAIRRISDFWQTELTCLNGFSPIEALCVDKFEHVQLAADKWKEDAEIRMEKMKLNIVDKPED